MDALQPAAPSARVLEALRAAVSGDHIRSGGDMEPKHFGDHVVPMAAGEQPLAVAFPASTAEVSAILRVCHAHRVPVVPQGGLTGLAGGATPLAGAVALSLERMRAIEEIDVAAATMTVEAGVPLQTIQQAADAAGMLFALDIGARGSCLIGGNVSTNAGGNRVLRYGMTRQHVLGLEVVLADGTVMTSLNKMLKNNAGYDLKQLFIGAEGSLGVITRVVLRLFPRPDSVCTAVVALPDYRAVLALLGRARHKLGDTLAAFEVMWPEFYELVTTAHGCRPPVPRGHGLYVLMESLGTDQAPDAAQFEALIEAALEAGEVEDAAIAQSLRESREMWELRDSVIQFRQSFHPHIGFDVSVPVARMQEFVTDCRAHLLAAEPGARVLWFGHVADSNLHISYQQQPGGLSKPQVDEIVYGRVKAFGGSVSAEHGIGLLKKPWLGYSRSPVEIDIMRRVKAALDPDGILNPGKIF